MSNKITALFGADVSEVEAKMLQAQRSTKAYEDAVAGIAKAEAKSNPGSWMGKITEKSPQLLGHVKSLISALGQASLSALLVPGLGVAAVGVSGLIAGINYVKKGYEDAAKAAAEMKQTTLEIGKLLMDREKIGKSEADNIADEIASLKLKRDIVASTAATLGEGAGGDSDKQILELNKQIETLVNKRLDMESKAAQEKEKKDSDFAKSSEAQNKKKKGALEDEIAQLEEAAKISAMTDAERLAAIQKEIYLRSGLKPASGSIDELENKREILKLEAQAGDVKKSIADKEKQEADKQNAKDQAARDKDKSDREEADRMAYERKWKFATDEQKLAQAKKEGQEAFARAQFEANGENLRDLEKARKKYIDLQEAISGKKGGKGGGESLMNNGVKVSAEDRARTNAASAQAEKYNEESKRGRIESSAGIGEGKSKTEDIVKPMQDLLKEVQNLTKKFN